MSLMGFRTYVFKRKQKNSIYRDEIDDVPLKGEGVF